jgi:tripartite-type tricarboxylate transporter receptor subunit TctC
MLNLQRNLPWYSPLVNKLVLAVAHHLGRTLILGVAVCAAFFSTCTSAQQSYPNRPLRMVVPWPPGQATDVAGRVVAQRLADALGQPVVVDNRPGAGGMIGTDIVAKAAADGYTLLAASSGPVSISPLLQKTPYDAERDFAPVAKVGGSPYLLVTSATFPAANAREFVALLKANPGKYTFASSGTGASAHLVAELFNSSAGVQATHVPYKGSAAALTDVISGQVAYTFETASTTLPLIRAGRLRVYGVSLGRPSPVAPGIDPIARTTGMNGFDIGGWIGVMVAKATPRAIVNRLAAAVDTLVRTADVQEKLASLYIDVDYLGPDAFARDLKLHQTRFSEIIKKGNIRIE